MTYAEADRRFGSDKPDTRFGLEIEDATEATRGSEFGVFAGAEAVRFLRVPRVFSRSEIAALEERAKERGAKGLAYLIRDETRRDPLADREVPLGGRARGARAGSRARRSSSRPTRGTLTSRVLGAPAAPPRPRARPDRRRRVHVPLGDRLPDVRVGRGRGALDARSTTRSRGRPTSGATRSPSDPGSALAYAYDLIVNGNELGGGSFRIHEPELQAQVFDLLALTAGRAAREVRLPARRARDGRAAARRHRARHRPDDDGARGRAEPPRRDRVPEEPGGPRPDVGRADRRSREPSSTSSGSRSSSRSREA